MSGTTTPLATTLATFGLAIGGPVALLSGFITFVTIPSGIPSAVVTIFVISMAISALSALVFLAERAKRDA
ncbi:MAG TPA: hypothetical protein VLG28_05250 [Acidimicrobiia bacterium]|nr:hypothetical protein [Acidimicrobiia bacterium]